jgi:hypothetical protein
MRADLKVLPHPNQIGQRLGMHFAHHPPAMNLDRVFGYVQFGRNLLVKEPRNYLLHDFLLARSERLIAVLQLAHGSVLLPDAPIAFYGFIDCP